MTPTNRTKLRRLPERGSHETEAINSILDAAFLAHIAFQTDGQPIVIPTLFGRERDKLFFHGSAASRMLREIGTGMPMCVNVTLVDGLVLARSAFNHSMNYRSVVAFGTARKIDDDARKLHALRVISDHVLAGRWEEVRGPNDKEMKATSVLEFTIEEASAKVRTGPPHDDEEDYQLPVWAGVLPLELKANTPIPDPELADGIQVPEYVAKRAAKQAFQS